jgi:Ca2+-binding RTX toxin-like protein
MVAWLTSGSVALAACLNDADGDAVCDEFDVCPNTIAGSIVDAAGCPPGIPGDFDIDGDVDGEDFALMSACESGPGVAAGAGCQTRDMDADTDVDLLDFQTFQQCFSGENQPGNPACAPHHAFIEDGCLHILGTAADTSLVLRLKFGLPLILEVDVGADGSVEFSFIRANFNCIIVDARGGDDIVTINEFSGVFTNTEATTIYGGDGNDTLNGGSGAEMFVGGPGDDSAFLGFGDDHFIWNPGDGTDFIEGGDGIDTIEVNGSDAGEQFAVTANGTRVRFDRFNPDPFFLDIGTCEELVVNAGGGDDTVNCTGNLAALIHITADGGAGNDTLRGSNGQDVLIGGDDNDFIDGNQGNDIVWFGAGDDVFQWDPGDGSDTLEGEAGHDVLVFNGSAGNEIYDLLANGPRVQFLRNIGIVTMDMDDVEQLDLQALGGTDIVNVSDLSGTDLAELNVDLAGVPGGDTGDAVADSVVVNGTNDNDNVVVTGSGTDVTVLGLSVVVNIATAEPANDRLTVNALGGDDVVDATGLPAGVIALTVNGGIGNDRLTGSGGNDELNGDDNSDTIIGGDGNDVVNLGAGNDFFIWNPGDDTDIVEGGDGFDSVEVNGGDGAEDFAVTANGTRVRFDRTNPAPFALDMGACEELLLNANGGADVVSATGNLAALILLTVDGGPGGDIILGSNGSDLLIGGDDNDLIDGNQGSDVILCGAGDDVFKWDPGDGSDLVEGEAGNDIVEFNGSGANEIFDLIANGSRLSLFRNIGNIIMDADGFEQLDLQVLGGTDTVNVNDLAATDLTLVNVDLAGTLGGGSGDALADTVVVNGTPNDDVIDIAANAGEVEVVGLAASVMIHHAESALDTLTFNGIGGVDTMTVGPGVSSLIMVNINQ